MMSSSPSEIIDNPAGNANAKTLGAAAVLCLTAAPTFAIMALLIVCPGSTGSDAICSARQGTSLLSSMVPMYLLMSAFHSVPWLKLVWIWRNRGCYGPACE